MSWYTLDENNRPILQADPMDACIWRDSHPERFRVARTELPDGVLVSTVFLCLDHSYDGGEPVLWETMIFGGIHDQDQNRYTSYEAALEGHAQMVELALEKK